MSDKKDAVLRFREGIKDLIDQATDDGLEPRLAVMGLVRMDDGVSLVNALCGSEDTFMKALGSSLLTLRDDFPDEYKEASQLYLTVARLIIPVEPDLIARYLKAYVSVIIGKPTNKSGELVHGVKRIMEVCDVMQDTLDEAADFLIVNKNLIITDNLNDN